MFRTTVMAGCISAVALAGDQSHSSKLRLTQAEELRGGSSATTARRRLPAGRRVYDYTIAKGTAINHKYTTATHHPNGVRKRPQQHISAYMGREGEKSDEYKKGQSDTHWFYYNQQKYGTADSACQASIDDIATLTREVAYYKGLYDACQKEIEDAKRKLSQSGYDLGNLQTRLDGVIDELTTTTTKLKTSMKLSEELRLQLEAVKTQSGIDQLEIQRLTANLEALRRQTANSQTAISDLEEQNTYLFILATGFYQQLQTAYADAGTQGSRIQSLTGAIAYMDACISGLKSQKKDLKDANVAITKQLSMYKAFAIAMSLGWIPMLVGAGVVYAVCKMLGVKF